MSWNEGRVRVWFNARDSRNILNIGLPAQTQPDSWRWLGDPRGTFSVKSAYKLVTHSALQDQSSWDWKILWNSPIHGRLKFLWWQLMRDALPTRKKIGIAIPLQSHVCPICETREETTLHLFWDCPYASQSGLENHRPQILSFDEFMTGALCIFKAIWEERNEVIHGSRIRPIMEAINSVNRQYNDHRSTWKSKAGKSVHKRITDAGWGNCFTDVSIQPNHSFGAAVFRDNMDRIMSIYSKRFSATDPTLAKASMLASAAEYAMENLKGKIVFYCDNDVVVVNCSTICNTNQVLDIKGVADRFNSVVRLLEDSKLRKIDRNFNFLAHNSAKWVAKVNATGVLDLGSMDANIFSDVREWAPD
ncbi:hypothetical protein F8388_014530 [Cannabis sativa]|uniref:Reverse transcriptase zinc-binding domain-containing protein n=1 Tax=Cannabis sativa TaxID=3483 RepID=A0A7J6FYP2_CANSA|nr:hypothetical protein F8388_014530 [Cannabis sativa]